jgi:pyruvate,water dikinase
MSPIAADLDTQPHPVFTTYSAGNFAEVAPERLSVMSWSLLGDPVERGVRQMVSRLWPTARWHTGSHYVFVGYVNCRPYHNLSAFCHMAQELPGLAASDVTSAYFEDSAPPPLPRGLRTGALPRALAVPRMAHELASLRPRLVKLEGEMVELEERADLALSSASLPALGATVESARRTLDRAWALHYNTTLALVPLRAVQSRLGRRFVSHWEELEPWLNRPRELVWTMLTELGRAEAEIAATNFLGRGFYELADDQWPWSDFACRAPATFAGGGGDRRRRWLDPAAVAWDVEPFGKLALLPQISRTVADTMSCRETSKSLAMRCMHVFRRLIPPLADVADVDAAAWPYLTIDELTAVEASPRLEAAARRRRDRCEEALGREAPEQINFAQRTSRKGVGTVPRRPALGLSPGRVTGTVVDHLGARQDHGGPKILVCEAADADVQPLLPMVDGMITVRGSALSHVAILVREHGIPAVVGHPLTGKLVPGMRVAIDGTRGEVTLVGDAAERDDDGG